VPVFVGDRGYTRARLLERCLHDGTWLLLRGRAEGPSSSPRAAG
jgi:hypothetical protein